MLKKLVMFIFNKQDDGFCSLYDTVESIDGDPIASRQKLIRDFSVLDHLIDICYFPLKLQSASILDKSQSKLKIRDVMSWTYDCMRYSIQEYRPNELYCSQWLSLLIEESAEKGSSGVMEKVEDCLKELIDNNLRDIFLMPQRIKFLEKRV